MGAELVARRCGAVLAAVVLALAGCGGGPDGDDPTPEGAATVAAADAGSGTGPGTGPGAGADPTGTPRADKPAGGAEATGVAACELLTVAEVGGLFGMPATVDDQTPADSTKECTWVGRKGALHQLHLQIYTGTSYFSPTRWAGTAEPVTGLGDEAFLVRESPLGVTAGLRDGERVLFVNYQILLSAGARPTDRADDVTDLLRAAAGRF